MKKTSIAARVGVSGRFRLEKKDRAGNIVFLKNFENLITDNGLNLLSTSTTKWSYCSVGSGNSNPVDSNVQLDNFIASAFNPIVTPGIYTTERQSYIRFQYTFGVGAVVGNVSEVGVGPVAGGTNLFSRALVKDSGGNPVSISILADEQLIVTYEFLVSQPVTDFVSNVDGYDIVLRASLVNGGPGNWTMESSSVARIYTDTFSTAIAQAFTGGSLGDITSEPSGSPRNRSFAVLHTYVAGSHQTSATITWSPGSFSGTVNAFRFGAGIVGFWQLSVTPSIVKTVDDRIELDVFVIWAREGELP